MTYNSKTKSIFLLLPLKSFVKIYKYIKPRKQYKNNTSIKYDQL